MAGVCSPAINILYAPSLAPSPHRLFTEIQPPQCLRFSCGSYVGSVISRWHPPPPIHLLARWLMALDDLGDVETVVSNNPLHTGSLSPRCSWLPASPKWSFPLWPPTEYDGHGGVTPRSARGGISMSGLNIAVYPKSGSQGMRLEL